MTIHVENNGAEIVSSNYWASEYARAQLIFASVNAGALRLLLPPARAFRDLVHEVRGAEYAVLSRGPWSVVGFQEAIEIMWEDGSDTPYAIHLAVASLDLLPAEPEPGKEWIVSTWELVAGKPSKGSEHRLYWQRVERIPWMQKLKRVSPATRKTS